MDVKTAYEQWLHDFAADADTIADLKAIANDPAEIEDRFYTELSFGTAGMRGVLGAGMNRMNRYNVRRATKGLAKYLLQNPQEAQRSKLLHCKCSIVFKDDEVALAARRHAQGVRRVGGNKQHLPRLHMIYLPLYRHLASAQ